MQTPPGPLLPDSEEFLQVSQLSLSELCLRTSSVLETEQKHPLPPDVAWSRIGLVVKRRGVPSL